MSGEPVAAATPQVSGVDMPSGVELNLGSLTEIRVARRGSGRKEVGGRKRRRALV